jgi:hypothetical protein
VAAPGSWVGLITTDRRYQRVIREINANYIRRARDLAAMRSPAPEQERKERVN